jgi:hypothetical protein
MDFVMDRMLEFTDNPEELVDTMQQDYLLSN